MYLIRGTQPHKQEYKRTPSPRSHRHTLSLMLLHVPLTHPHEKTQAQCNHIYPHPVGTAIFIPNHTDTGTYRRCWSHVLDSKRLYKWTQTPNSGIPWWFSPNTARLAHGLLHFLTSYWQGLTVCTEHQQKVQNKQHYSVS